jgi:hypothetical protein
MEITPLSKEEIAALQNRAAMGIIPTLEEIRRYIASTRISYLAAESKSKPKDRIKKPDTKDDTQIDFF